MPNNTSAGGGGGVGGGAGGVGGGGGGGSSFGGRGTWGFRKRIEPEPSRANAIVELRVAQDVPEDVLASATERALRAARDALPGRGSVRAEASAGEPSAGEIRVRVELTVTGQGADADWAKAAETGFARELIGRLDGKGYAARHVS